MSFITALTYPFKDREWPGKLGVTLLVAAIPLLGFFLIKGWEFETSVRVRRGDPYPLAAWHDPGKKLWRGLVIRFAEILYNIPTYIMLILGLIWWIGLFVRYLRGELTTLQSFTDLFVQSLAPRLGMLAATALYALLANILYWSGYLRYIETGRFSAFFDILPNLRLAFRTVWDDILVAIYLLVLGLLTGLLGTLLTAALGATGVGVALVPVLIPALTLTIVSWFTGYLFGVLAIRTLGEGAPAAR